ncbi:Di-copper centre-containing protein [Bimuria novae-zelandiae CBS 107.79]|uniref:tyrosinase n=1 Tax=Bimuria novae-zelandiae CBS 107.79 TaxID=1447943 RepID=A0A6A5UNM1_9PLEO|nr:Di-copper centre-containing protein [Bimuria novae-zelandiae CBS 107.79]
MRSSVVAAISILVTSTYGFPLLTTKADPLEKRQSAGSYYAIKGASGGIHPRVEVRDLENAGGEPWNLFLLAMREFQAMDQHVIDSWYQIAGIHGMPRYAWDGVEGGGNIGYCPHNQLLFGTWHRPYLALFEQKLQQIARSIASRFPTATRAKYQDAAARIRIPYWDWAKALPTDQPVVPTSMTVEKVSVMLPDGTTARIDNPLYDYNFHPLDNKEINGTGCSLFTGGGTPTGGLPQVCQNSNKTIRAGQTESDHPGLNSKLRSILPSQRTLLYNILSQYQTFTQVASAQTCDGTAKVGTLENLHNAIHNANFPGHMSPSGVTAFDPMFWMHHANVDRQLALHQAIFPGAYIKTCSAGTPTYTIDIGDQLDASSPLTPFHRNAAGDFWTSDSARNIQDLGYTYPELANNPSNATIVASIKKQYSGPADVAVTTTKTSREAKRDTALVMEELYLTEITLPSYGLDNGMGGGAPYNVLLFLGDVPTDAKDWQDAESFVGLASTLGAPGLQVDQTTSHTIDLSLALQRAVTSGATTQDEAQEYLKQNLHYRLGLGAMEIKKEMVKGLEVSLISTAVEVAQSDDTFDRWVGGFQEHGLIEG